MFPSGFLNLKKLGADLSPTCFSQSHVPKNQPKPVSHDKFFLSLEIRPIFVFFAGVDHRLDSDSGSVPFDVLAVAKSFEVNCQLFDVFEYIRSHCIDELAHKHNDLVLKRLFFEGWVVHSVEIHGNIDVERFAEIEPVD